ncbi:MAG: nucleotidyltransferase substrate binding protein [Victivallales bacterium]|nr:nucleotidyltransferase substrate binding protein [Victivallales bacterium]
MDDIRWLQRLNNFKKALSNLTEAVDLAKTRELSKLEKQGLIQAFEFTHELAWNTVKDFYQSLGEVNIQGSRDAFRLAFNRGLIEDGDIFMKSIQSRQLSVHTYNEDSAEEIMQDVVRYYHKAFVALAEKLEKEVEKKK